MQRVVLSALGAAACLLFAPGARGQCPPNTNPLQLLVGSWVFQTTGVQYQGGGSVPYGATGQFVASIGGVRGTLVIGTDTESINGQARRKGQIDGVYDVNADCSGGFLSTGMQYDFWFKEGFQEIWMVSSDYSHTVVGKATRMTQASPQPPSNGQTVLLAPWVVYTQGFDTSIAISNTTKDQLGTTAQSGNCQICYYSAGAAPPCQTTNAPIPAGQTLVFTLSGGGNFGIGPIPNGFAGYIIAKCGFPGAHGVGVLQAFGALPTSPGFSAAVPILVLPGTRNLALVESLGQ